MPLQNEHIFQIGFNAGNGTRAYEYEPYSQSAKITDVLVMGNVSGWEGRHIFRIDEQILPGVCNYEKSINLVFFLYRLPF